MEGDGIVTRTAVDPVGVVVERLLTALESRGIEVFTVIDHSGAAKRVGQQLRETKLVVFGNPTVGTPLMSARPLIALDLPLKILVWSGHDGETSVSYNDPSFLANRYDISDPFRLQALAAVEVLADLIVRSPEG
jgi:uncharacterized protein (DUF302 family)